MLNANIIAYALMCPILKDAHSIVSRFIWG